MRGRQVGRVAKRHIAELLRERRTLMIIFLIPVLTILLLSVTRDELISSLGSEGGPPKKVAVQGAGSAPALVAFLDALPSLELFEVDDVRAAVVDAEVSVGLALPPGSEEAMRTGNQVELTIVRAPPSLATQLAEIALTTALDAFSAEVVNQRLADAGLPPETAVPLRVTTTSVASEAQRTGGVLADFLPFMVLAQVVALMASTAIDMTTGERERRTLEALVVTPLSRREIVFGKWIPVIGLGTAGALITTAAGWFGFRATTGAVGGSTSDLPPGAIGAMVAGAIALALVFGSLQLLIGFFARSSHQAGALSSPLMFLVIIPVFLFQARSGTTVSGLMYAIPGLGPTLLSRFGLSGTAAPNAFVITVATSVVYAALILLLADRVFRSERALMRA